MLDFLQPLYESGRPIEGLGDAYKPPRKFEHGKEYLVAELKKDPPHGDGQDVQIFECRMPARFFKMVALPSPNSIGEPQTSFKVSTGSGGEVAELLVQFANAVTTGMMSIDVAGPDEVLHFAPVGDTH